MNQNNDLISRQAAIDALKNRWKKTRNYEGIGDDIAEECELYLKQLPSAQPDHTADIGKKVEAGDCIDRQAAIDAMSEALERVFPEHRQIAEKCINALPSAQPATSCSEIPNSSDSISRQAAIDLFPDDDLEYDTKGGYIAPHLARQMICELPSVQPDLSEYSDKLWKSAYERGKTEAQPEEDWTLCSKRLPEESGKYFVTVLDGIGKRTTSAPYHLRSKSWTLTGRMAYWRVIAWRPLPEPYRGGEK